MSKIQIGQIIGIAIFVITIVAAVLGIQIDIPVVDPQFPVK